MYKIKKDKDKRPQQKQCNKGNEHFSGTEKKNCQCRILYMAKIYLKNEGGIKIIFRHNSNHKKY